MELRTKLALFTLTYMVPCLCMASSIHWWRERWLSYIMPSDITDLSSCSARRMPDAAVASRCNLCHPPLSSSIHLHTTGYTWGHHGLAPPSTPPPRCLCHNITDTDSGRIKKKAVGGFGWGEGGKVTSAGWQVTLCDPIWYLISRSGVVKFTNCYTLFTLLLLTYLSAVVQLVLHLLLLVYQTTWQCCRVYSTVSCLWLEQTVDKHDECSESTENDHRGPSHRESSWACTDVKNSQRACGLRCPAHATRSTHRWNRQKVKPLHWAEQMFNNLVVCTSVHLTAADVFQFCKVAWMLTFFLYFKLFIVCIS